MQSRGFTPEQILAGTSLSWDRFHEVSDFLNFEQMRRLIMHCMQLAECPWLGIESPTAHREAETAKAHRG